MRKIMLSAAVGLSLVGVAALPSSAQASPTVTGICKYLQADQPELFAAFFGTLDRCVSTPAKLCQTPIFRDIAGAFFQQQPFRNVGECVSTIHTLPPF
jgi:hypothetical protein